MRGDGVGAFGALGTGTVRPVPPLAVTAAFDGDDTCDAPAEDAEEVGDGLVHGTPAAADASASAWPEAPAPRIAAAIAEAVVMELGVAPVSMYRGGAAFADGVCISAGG